MPRRVIALSLALGLAVALMPAAPAAGTVGWTSSMTLATGASDKRDITIFGDRVLWVEAEANPTYAEVWMRSIGDAAAENVSDRPNLSDSVPAIDGDRIAWIGQFESGTDVFTWKIGDATVTHVGFDGAQEVKVSGDRLFWSGLNDLAEPDYEIYTWAVGDTTPTNVSNNPGAGWNDQDVRVSGDRVVWTGFDGTDREVYTWAVSDPVRRNLSNNAFGDANPEVSGDRVVWENSGTGDWEVYSIVVGDAGPTNISNRPGLDDYAPSVSGDRIAWEAETLPSGNNDVFLLEVGDPEPMNLSNTDDVYDWEISISGDHVVWQADEADDSEVYAWSATLGAVNLSDNGTNDYDPVVSDGRVAWLNHDAGTYSVMAAKLVPTALTAVPVAGETRIGTAIEASQLAFADDSVETVVIATAYNWPDALGGAALAGAVGGPILLTAAADLPAAVADEIDRLGASEAIILGGEAAVSGAVLDELEGLLGLGNVDRIGGDDRYATARMIAAATVAELGVAYNGTAFVATGANFPDALGASPLAAANGWPIYLVNPALGADAVLTAAMADDGVTEALVLGGVGAVAAEVEADLVADVPCATDRFDGEDRYETACKVAAYGVSDGGLSWNRLAIATGTDFPDALAGGVLQGRSGSVMLLTPGTALNGDVAALLAANADVIDEVRFLGGPAAVSEAVRDAVATALGF